MTNDPRVEAALDAYRKTLREHDGKYVSGEDGVRAALDAADKAAWWPIEVDAADMEGAE